MSVSRLATVFGRTFRQVTSPDSVLKMIRTLLARRAFSVAWITLTVAIGDTACAWDEPGSTLRVATFNASLNRNKPGALLKDLSNSDDAQARNVAEIIQRVAPDVLLINEFDYDEEGKAAELFQRNYLSKSWNGAPAIVYSYSYAGDVNTGVSSGKDFDGDGKAVGEPGERGYGNDALGYGLFPGQYGLVIYSKFPIETGKIRVFTSLLWKEMPGALLPKKPDGTAYYSDDALSVFRLSSKAHWDVPIQVGGKSLHLLASHPTPPAFDGAEDRNGKRNHDEIRLWADYLTGGTRSAYLDRYVKGGKATPPEFFVVLGDLNSDPVDGGSVPGAIGQLLEHPKINALVVPKSEGAAEASLLQKGANADHKGPAETDTADFDERVGNLRADYVLPSKTLKVKAAGVFWPKADDPLARLVKMSPKTASSDHRLVFIDIERP